MSIRKTALAGLTALTLAVVGCRAPPEIEEARDFTGDGIKDILITAPWGPSKGPWLFIGQKDSSYIRARMGYTYLGTEHKQYFLVKDDTTYILDGEFYRPIQNKK